MKTKALTKYICTCKYIYIYVYANRNLYLSLYICIYIYVRNYSYIFFGTKGVSSGRSPCQIIHFKENTSSCAVWSFRPERCELWSNEKKHKHTHTHCPPRRYGHHAGSTAWRSQTSRSCSQCITYLCRVQRPQQKIRQYVCVWDS